LRLKDFLKGKTEILRAGVIVRCQKRSQPTENILPLLPVSSRYRRTTPREELARSYHIPVPTTTRSADQLQHRSDSGCPLDPGLDPETKQRSLDTLRWGLIPHWAKDPKIMNKTINARVQTVDTAPSYRQAFKKRRCLIPCDGSYEWKKVLGGKIPYSISMKDDSPFVFAGLWEGWKDPAKRGMVAYLHDHHWRTE
jgi:putative SOS response-associated peptidase YedK